jgi:hypothetical protein
MKTYTKNVETGVKYNEVSKVGKLVEVRKENTSYFTSKGLGSESRISDFTSQLISQPHL